MSTITKPDGGRILYPLFAAILVAAGCSSRPGRISPPQYDAAAIGEQAVRALDRDGDEKLAERELAASPALRSDLRKLDRDGDNRLSCDEIAAKVAEWTEGGVGAVAALCLVKRGGVPMPGVHVKFIPEAFMGNVVQPASGVSDAGGAALLTAENQAISGVVNCGYYRVELSLPKDGKETLPSKFNVHTVLGAEVRQKMEVNIEFDLAR